MPKHNLSLAIFLLIGVAITLTAIQVIRHDQVLSTTARYIIEDTSTNHGNKNLMLGSSSIKRLGHHDMLQCGPWLNRGIGSSTISSLNRYLKWTELTIEPQVVLIYAGENDVSKGLSRDEVFEQYKAFIERLVKRFPDSEIHIIGIKPSPRRQSSWDDFEAVNSMVKVYAGNQPGVFFHPSLKESDRLIQAGFLSDGIHLTEQGYDLFISGFNKACVTR